MQWPTTQTSLLPTLGSRLTGWMICWSSLKCSDSAAGFALLPRTSAPRGRRGPFATGQEHQDAEADLPNSPQERGPRSRCRDNDAGVPTSYRQLLQQRGGRFAMGRPATPGGSLRAEAKAKSRGERSRVAGTATADLGDSLELLLVARLSLS